MSVFLQDTSEPITSADVQAGDRSRLLTALPGAPGNLGNWPTYRRLLPHAPHFKGQVAR
ncbi:hypothetical protein ACWDWV_00235 [Streptosporangium sandarakinum]